MPVLIVVGSYEEFILGYSLVKNDEGVYKLEMAFANHGHISSVRALAASGKFIASGGIDETIHLLNMKTRKEVGTLIQHNGTITSLEFYENSHLFSGSEDGTICAWTTNNWQCIKTLRGHKSGVLSLSVHPTGKLLLSVSKDKTLRTWNTIKGRSAYVINIKAVAELVCWSPDGSYFLISINNRIDVYSVETAGIIHTINFGRRINCISFILPDVIAVGGEGENVEVHNISTKAVLCIFKAHDNRIKSMKCINDSEENRKDMKLLITSSSDGYIKVWEICLKQLDRSPKVLAEINATCRLTCMAVWIEAPFFDDEQKNKDNEIAEKSLEEGDKGFPGKECIEESEPVKVKRKSVHFSDESLEQEIKKKRTLKEFHGKKLKKKSRRRSD